MKSAFLLCLVLCAAWPLRPGQDRSKAGPDESRLLALESAWNLAEENKDITRSTNFCQTRSPTRTLMAHS